MAVKGNPISRMLSVYLPAMAGLGGVLYLAISAPSFLENCTGSLCGYLEATVVGTRVQKGQDGVPLSTIDRSATTAFTWPDGKAVVWEAADDGRVIGLRDAQDRYWLSFERLEDTQTPLREVARLAASSGGGSAVRLWALTKEGQLYWRDVGRGADTRYPWVSASTQPIRATVLSPSPLGNMVAVGALADIKAITIDRKEASATAGGSRPDAELVDLRWISSAEFWAVRVDGQITEFRSNAAPFDLQSRAVARLPAIDGGTIRQFAVQPMRNGLTAICASTSVQLACFTTTNRTSWEKVGSWPINDVVSLLRREPTVSDLVRILAVTKNGSTAEVTASPGSSLDAPSKWLLSESTRREHDVLTKATLCPATSDCLFWAQGRHGRLVARDSSQTKWRITSDPGFLHVAIDSASGRVSVAGFLGLIRTGQLSSSVLYDVGARDKNDVVWMPVQKAFPNRDGSSVALLGNQLAIVIADGHQIPLARDIADIARSPRGEGGTYLLEGQATDGPTTKTQRVRKFASGKFDNRLCRYPLDYPTFQRLVVQPSPLGEADQVWLVGTDSIVKCEPTFGGNYAPAKVGTGESREFTALHFDRLGQYSLLLDVTDGQVWRSIDAGATYAPSAINDVTGKVIEIAMSGSGRIAMAITDAGEIAKSADGGATWQRSTLPAVNRPWELTALALDEEGRTAIAVGAHSVILRTDNAGESWKYWPRPLLPIWQFWKGLLAIAVLVGCVVGLLALHRRAEARRVLAGFNTEHQKAGPSGSLRPGWPSADRLAHFLAQRPKVGPVVLGIEGLPGVGKTSFVNAVAEQLAWQGQPTVRFNALQQQSNSYLGALAHQIQHQAIWFQHFSFLGFAAAARSLSRIAIKGPLQFVGVTFAIVFLLFGVLHFLQPSDFFPEAAARAIREASQLTGGDNAAEGSGGSIWSWLGTSLLNLAIALNLNKWAPLLASIAAVLSTSSLEDRDVEPQKPGARKRVSMARGGGTGPLPGEEQRTRERIEHTISSTFGERITVVIDDLDFCSPEDVRAVLAAISTLSEVPGLAFIVPMDRTRLHEKLAQALLAEGPTRRSKATSEASLEATHLIDKIVPVSFPIPTIRTDVRRGTASPNLWTRASCVFQWLLGSWLALVVSFFLAYWVSDIVLDRSCSTGAAPLQAAEYCQLNAIARMIAFGGVLLAIGFLFGLLAHVSQRRGWNAGGLVVEDVLAALDSKWGAIGFTPRQKNRVYAEIVLWELRGGEIEQTRRVELTRIGALTIVTARRSDVSSEGKVQSGALADVVWAAWNSNRQKLLAENGQTCSYLGLTAKEWEALAANQAATSQAVELLTGKVVKVEAG